MLQKIVKIFGGDPNKREIEQRSEIVDQINDLEEQFEAYSNEELRAKTDEFRRRQAEGEPLDDLLPEAFAVVREVSKRTLGQRHYDVQLIGGVVLHEGIIAEMRTGEGKTLAATLPIYLNTLELNPDWIKKAQRKWGEDPANWTFKSLENTPVGRGVHLITVNDYLARRDARWMSAIYDLLGLSVGVLQMAARTENGKKAFLVDFSRESPHEDQHHLRMVPRREAYAADITYGTNSEFGFDYLRDNMTMRLEDRVQRGHHYAIIDEVDNVLIDEARTPLIISGPSHDDTEWYERMAADRQAAQPGGLRGQRARPQRHPDRDRRSPRRELLEHAAARPRAPRRRHTRTGPPAGLPGAGPASAVPLPAQQGIPGPGRESGHRRRVYRAVNARAALVGWAAPGGRGQGRRADPAGERHLRHDHHPELLPHVREAGRYDRHCSHRGGRVQRDL